MSKREGEIDIDCARRLRTTYMTPFDEGLFGHAKKRSTGRLRDKPALQDMIIERISSIVYTNAMFGCFRLLQIYSPELFTSSLLLAAVGRL